jgi:hypothetical protein
MPLLLMVVGRKGATAQILSRVGVLRGIMSTSRKSRGHVNSDPCTRENAKFRERYRSGLILFLLGPDMAD